MYLRKGGTGPRTDRSYYFVADDLLAGRRELRQGVLRQLAVGVDRQRVPEAVAPLRVVGHVGGIPEPVQLQVGFFMQRLGVNDLFYPDNRIKQLCEREKIAVITLAPWMETYADQNKTFLHGFGNNIGNGHWNQLGHQVAGEFIAQKLCEGVVK